jgi:hypothetical protein
MKRRHAPIANYLTPRAAPKRCGIVADRLDRRHRRPRLWLREQLIAGAARLPPL